MAREHGGDERRSDKKIPNDETKQKKSAAFAPPQIPHAAPGNGTAPLASAFPAAGANPPQGAAHTLRKARDTEERKPGRGQHSPLPVPPEAMNQSDTKPTYKHLSQLLVALRESFFERVSTAGPEMPHVRLSARALAEALNKNGYSMTSGSYSMLEQGKSLPKNPGSFFQVLEKCLAIAPSSEEARLLRELYLRDFAQRVLDDPYTATIQVND